MAEHYRHDLAIQWLGAALPNWAQPCPIHAQVAPNLGAGGQTSFTFDHNEVFGWHMEIQGTHERLLDSVLPHEVTHTIFASHFRRPLPRWADEGACTTVEDISERSKQDRMLIVFLHTGRGIAFSQMFAMTDYPQDILPLYAQGYSLARFLIDQSSRQAFLTFLNDGMASENWSDAIHKHYGYRNLAELQDAWLNWVKIGSPSRLPNASGRSGDVALAGKNGNSNVIVRAQASDHATPTTRAVYGTGNSATYTGGGAGGESQWAPVRRPAPPTQLASAAPTAISPATTVQPAGAIVPASKSVYGEGVGLVQHSADMQTGTGATTGAAPAASQQQTAQLPATQPTGDAPAAQPAMATGNAAPQAMPSRKVLLEWSRQQQQ